MKLPRDDFCKFRLPLDASWTLQFLSVSGFSDSASLGASQITVCPDHTMDLSGSHRSTHIASDLASRALASQAKLQRESESRAFRIARSREACRFFRIAGQHRRIFAGALMDLFLLIQINLRGFRIASEQLFRIASDFWERKKNTFRKNNT